MKNRAGKLATSKVPEPRRRVLGWALWSHAGPAASNNGILTVGGTPAMDRRGLALRKTGVKRLRRPKAASLSADEPTQALVLHQKPLGALLARLEATQPRLTDASASPSAESIEEHHNTALGCKTSEVALTLLAQVVTIERPNIPDEMPQAQLDDLMLKATAMVAELEPKTATETLLAVQMIGAHRLAMLFLRRAGLEGPPDLIDANVLRATRLMRVFNEQLEAMAKLKGKSGQQRVVVEHVTVNKGGRAIVGAVAATNAVSRGDGG